MPQEKKIPLMAPREQLLAYRQQYLQNLTELGRLAGEAAQTALKRAQGAVDVEPGAVESSASTARRVEVGAEVLREAVAAARLAANLQAEVVDLAQELLVDGVGE